MNKPITLFKNCFTLIEVLAVIIVITLLTSILLPGLVQARGKSNQTKCLSNLKQFGLAVAMYSDDHDGYLPSHNDAPTSNWDCGVFTPREYYGNDFSILKCPDDTDYQAPPQNVTDPFPNMLNDYYWSYCYNMQMSANFPSQETVARLPSFIQPSSTVTFFEANETDGGVENVNFDGPVDNPTLEPYIRHNVGAHYLFADFHVAHQKSFSLRMANFTPEAD